MFSAAPAALELEPIVLLKLLLIAFHFNQWLAIASTSTLIIHSDVVCRDGQTPSLKTLPGGNRTGAFGKQKPALRHFFFFFYHS